jgi:hypothetical protein
MRFFEEYGESTEIALRASDPFLCEQQMKEHRKSASQRSFSALANRCRVPCSLVSKTQRDRACFTSRPLIPARPNRYLVSRFYIHIRERMVSQLTPCDSPKFCLPVISTRLSVAFQVVNANAPADHRGTLGLAFDTTPCLFGAGPSPLREDVVLRQQPAAMTSQNQMRAAVLRETSDQSTA